MPSVDDLPTTCEGIPGRAGVQASVLRREDQPRAILSPMAKVRADLYLPSGEISDTLLYPMARTGAEDGRPMVVFVVADFDPAGNQMAVSIGRKLQALRDLHFPRSIQVRAVALTEDQVRELDLPSTPLKVTEKRADRWREAHGGLEQTEIDALATLRPDVLREIVEDALDPFFDHTLEQRVFQAKGQWLDEAADALSDQMSSETMLMIRARAELQIENIRRQLGEIEEATEQATEGLDLDLPVPVIPEPVIDENLQPLPLIASDWSWADQTAALVAESDTATGPRHDRRPQSHGAHRFPMGAQEQERQQIFLRLMGLWPVLMFRGEEITHDNGDVVQTWNLLVQEREQRLGSSRPATPSAASGHTIALAMHGGRL